jgi:hypothetical protein
MFLEGGLGILYILVSAGIIQNYSLRRQLDDLVYNQTILSLIEDEKLKSIDNKLDK